MLGPALAGAGCQGCRARRQEQVVPAADIAPLAADAGVLGSDAPVTAGSRVFLLRFGGDLIPFGCYDGAARALRPGAECLELVGADPHLAVVQLEGNQQRLRTLRVKPAIHEFVLSGKQVTGFRLDLPCARGSDQPPYSQPCAGAPDDAGAYGVWPASFGQVTLARPSPTARPKGAVPAEIVAELDPILREIGFARRPAMTLHQTLSLDLDGDRRSETVLSVRVDTDHHEGDDEAKTSELPRHLFFLYLRVGDRYRRMSLPESTTIETRGDAEVIAYFDLDGDRAMELWLETPYYEGRDWLLARWRGGAWQVIDNFGDGT